MEEYPVLDAYGLKRLCCYLYSGPVVLVEYGKFAKIVGSSRALEELFHAGEEQILTSGFQKLHPEILDDTKAQIRFLLNKGFPFIVDILNEDTAQETFWVRCAIFDLNNGFFLGLETKLDDSAALPSCPFSFPKDCSLSDVDLGVLYKVQSLFLSLEFKSLTESLAPLNKVSILADELESFEEWLKQLSPTA